MGINVIPLNSITPEVPKTLMVNLLRNMDPNDVQNDKSRGQVILEVTYKPFKGVDIEKEVTDNSGMLEKAPEGTLSGGGLPLVIHEAQDLEGKHHTNTYVRLLFKAEKRKTKVHSFTC